MGPEEPGGAANPPAQPKSCKTQNLTTCEAGTSTGWWGDDLPGGPEGGGRAPGGAGHGLIEISCEKAQNRLPPGDGDSPGHRLAVLGSGRQRTLHPPPLPPTSHRKLAASLFARTLLSMEKTRILKMLFIIATLCSLGFVNYASLY